MENREKVQYRFKSFLLILLLLTASTVFCLIRLVRIPGGDENLFCFGMTKERFLMASVFFAACILDLIALLFSKQLFRRLDKISIRSAEIILGSAAIVLCFFVLLPAYRFHRKAAIYERLKPFILCAFLYTVLLFHFFRFSRKPPRFSLPEKKVLRPFLTALAGCLLLGAFIALTKVGVTTESNLWNKNALPIQGIQIYVCFWAAWLFRRLFRGKFSDRRISFFVIWAAAALIWSFVPLNNQFFAPGPREPYQQYYPYSDAISYDSVQVEAQNGWGFNEHYIINKPVVTFFSYVTHMLTGNDYNRAQYLQSSLYGILPALIYLFGCSVGGNLCGWLAAVFSILREWNALTTTTVLTINSRVIMSEFAMQIIFAAFCWFSFRWLQQNRGQLFYAAGAGCMLALGIYTRYNFLIFLPALFLIGIAAFWKNKGQFLKSFALIILFMALISSPLLIRSYRITGVIYPEFTFTFRNVLLGQRYADSEVKETGTPAASADIEPETDELPEAAAAPADAPAVPAAEVPEQPGKARKIFFMGKSILNHTLHNILAQVSSLPLQFDFDDLEHLYAQTPDKPWNDHWEYHFSFGQWVFLAFWVLMFCADIAFLRNRFGFAGLSILWFWCIYAFSTGFSRSSGGRYIVPCNWVPCLFLALFIQIVFEHGKIENPVEAPEKRLTETILLTSGCFLMMISFTLIEAFTPTRVIGTEGDERVVLEEAFGTDFSEFGEDLLFSKGAIAYPLYFFRQKGGHSNYGPYQIMDYGRMVFLGLSQNQRRDYVLKHEEYIGDFPFGSEYYAVSSMHPGDYYQDILAVLVRTESGDTYTYTADGIKLP